VHPESWRAAERAARESYGRLLSWLAYQWRDVAAAEDALAEAFAAALITWPRDGIPRQPDAWLMTAAKHNLLHAARHQRVVDDPASKMLLSDDMIEDTPIDVPDERLKLMFVCAHPAIDAKSRTPLMLQTVLGLDAAHIASAFLISPTTMAQRLVRAKTKIRDAGLRFESPEASELAARMDAVLDAIYAAYGTSWDALDGAEDAAAATELAEEAIYLARLMVHLLPNEPESLGLLALMLFSHARQRARFSSSGAFIPLPEQDTARWDRQLMAEADTLLMTAVQSRRPGPFQLEAAIQSAHGQRAFTGITPWRGIATLYHGLLRIAPTLGTQVGFAVALIESNDLDSATDVLTNIAQDAVRHYQPYWVASAFLAEKRGEIAAAKSRLSTAIGLSTQQAIRHHLLARLRVLESGAS
jgi:RNA polymerase sigma-70 factor, ECF subfamily